jgi:hypothetical protein
MKYQARSYYQQNISRPHSYEEKPFNSQKAALAWAKSAYNWVFQVDIWKDGKLIICQTRWSGKNWKHHRV